MNPCALGELAGLHPRDLRALIRFGSYSGPTAGLAPGYVQANLVMLPADVANQFREFCENNPKPCPMLESTPPGVYEPRCAVGADLRTDVPGYRVYRRGELFDRTTDVLKNCDAGSLDAQAIQWVSFLLGCSFTFEAALLRAGIPVRHIEQKRNVPMYRANVACKPSGIFQGPMVVSMRPMTPPQAEGARRITALLPGAHGEPVHVGDPATIGIHDLANPEYGDAVEIKSGEIPVFWACGVTPLEAILRAKPTWAIVHEPGHMFVTDLRVEE